ncbi:MAG: hypothetical protein H0V04_07865 [Chloroflexi bacterium]|nr:hypothetical protein [Chloroflexota bacterium]
MWRAPSIASAARPGQYVHLRAPDSLGFVPLRRPLVICGIDTARGQVTMHVVARDPASTWFAGLRPGDRADLTGPLGQPLQVGRRTNHLLLIGHGHSMPALMPIADAAVAAGRQVTLLCGAASAAGVYPSSLLRDEVEYVVATADGSLGHRGTVVGLMPEYEAWADEAIAIGPLPVLEDLVRVARGRDARLGVARLGRRKGRSSPRRPTRSASRSWLTVFMDQSVGCALGVCLGCVVPSASGLVRVCREGPSFAADDLVWSGVE